MQALTALIGFFAVVVSSVPDAARAEFRLHAQAGRCEYSFDSVKDRQWTKCAAEAYIFDTTSSEVFRCNAEVEGDQHVAPSVSETAPDSVVCVALGKPFPQKGNYEMGMTDDHSRGERTFSRRQGYFPWKNAFWVVARDSFKVRFCAARTSPGGPDFRLYCSKDAELRR